MAFDPTISKSLPRPNRGFLFNFLKWILIIGICIAAISLVTKPIRKNWSNNYVQTGDVYLGQKKYSVAKLEYQKSLFLYKNNKIAQDRIKLAQTASENVLVLEDFYREKNISAQLDYFNLAKAIPENAVEATKNAKFLLENEEYQLAEIAAKTATELDQNYKSGWQYLEIAQKEVKEKVE